jgi:RNA polymerase sigma factor (sigma-70 family)
MATAPAGTLLRHVQKLASDYGVQQWSDRQLLEDFTSRRSESAFAALVGRHGPMVLRVCRRVLRHEQDAEDALQATFLVLARHTAAIQKRDALAAWLHGVAYCTAMKAKRTAARRRRHEALLQTFASRAAPSPAWDDVQAVLDEEVQRLPPCFREAFVRCVLEGQGGAEVAAALGCQAGTVKSRVSRARRLLQQRLARRGIELSALLAALSVAESAGRAAVPPTLVRAAVGLGLLAAAGSPAAGVIPPHVATLAAGVTPATSLTQAKIAIAVLVVALIAASAGALARQAPAAGGRVLESLKSQVGNSKPPAAQDKPNKEDIAYGGRVLGPDGKPVAGAKVYLTLWWGYHYVPFLSPESATTGRDGRFSFTIPRETYHDRPVIVAAAAPNLGPGWVGLSEDDKKTELTVKLVADDVPITGQIVNLQGKPVAGATLRLLQIMAAPKEDLGPWLAAAKDKSGPGGDRDARIAQQYCPRYTTAPSALATTDAAGRFRLSGVGRERLVIVQLDGPAIASEWLHIRTRPGEPMPVGHLEAMPGYTPRIDVTYYGSSFRHVAGPTKPVVGVVRDKDTKKPLANITVRSEKLAHNPLFEVHIVRCITDAQGRYRLTGLPKGAGNKIRVVPPADLPYVAPMVDVPDSFGPDAVTVDVELKRVVWIEGKLTDKQTGQPVRCYVRWLALPNNPNQRDYAGYYGVRGSPMATKEDGTYRVLGLPGPGLIVVSFASKTGYLHGAERDDEDGLKDELRYTPQRDFAALARVDPAKGVESVRRDIQLVRGWTFTGTLLGPDGKPLVGAVQAGGRARESRESGTYREVMKTAEFTVRSFNPRRPRPILFRYPAKGLVGLAPLPKENGGSVTVRMVPGAAVTGRVVDLDGTPRAGVEIRVFFRPKEEPHWDWDECGSHEPIKTDQGGHCRIDALSPGFDYYLSADHTSFDFGAGLRAGATKDLGDIRIKRPKP